MQRVGTRNERATRVQRPSLTGMVSLWDSVYIRAHSFTPCAWQASRLVQQAAWCTAVALLTVMQQLCFYLLTSACLPGDRSCCRLSAD